MANVLHKNLTGTDLHEPKGAASASANQVYVADGAASGAWFTLVPLGVVWDYWGATEPTGFLFADGQTIGNASSNGTARANADTSDLFSLLWTLGDTYGTINIYDSAGSESTFGADAATDFAANKAIALPDYRERVSIGADMQAAASRIDPSYVDAASPGETGGADAVTLVQANLPDYDLSHSLTAASHTHSSGSLAGGSHSHGNGSLDVSGVGTSLSVSTAKKTNNDGGQAVNYSLNTTTKSVGGSTASASVSISGSTGSSGSLSVSGTVSSGGSDTAFGIVQPTIVCNKIIFYGA